MMSVKSLGYTSRFKGSAGHGVFNNKCRHHDATQLTPSENQNNVAAMAKRVRLWSFVHRGVTFRHTNASV
jgi:hypothetical protein